MRTSAARDRPAILRLAAPLVFSFWFRSAFQWVDAAYASLLPGEGVGDASLAAIGLALPFEFALIACWVGASNGLTSRLAAALGAREGDRARQLQRAVLRICLVLSLAFLLLAGGIWTLAPRLPLDPLVARQFRVYGTVLLAGSALTTFWSVLPDSIVKAHHDTKSTMWAGVTSTLLNVTLNTVFVFVLHWGLAGIAFATVLGRLGGLAYASRQAMRHERARSARGHDDRPGTFARPVRAILTLALPAGASYLLLAGEGLALNGLLAATADPTASLTAWSIYDRSARFLLMPVIASAVAMLPLAARLGGRGEHGRIRRELRAIVLWGAGYAVLLAPAAWLLGPWLARALADAEQARERAAALLLLVPLLVLLAGPTFQLRSVFEGLQRPRPGLIASLARTGLLVVPLAAAGIRLAPAWGLDQVLGAALGQALGVGLASVGFAIWARPRLAGQRSRE